ncbi:hypothetical protein KUTeg_022282 [Tegillarca granosa]|uniref:Uncharacterized protein n=1 Tax=Tegillarca granosa TaxID=220873 RepID=A0ABQ9EBZ0_TEGGR|nr:hypothetical protein KUTeg_022282 [Tegillarca granosa]
MRKAVILLLVHCFGILESQIGSMHFETATLPQSIINTILHSALQSAVPQLVMDTAKHTAVINQFATDCFKQSAVQLAMSQSPIPVQSPSSNLTSSNMRPTTSGNRLQVASSYYIDVWQKWPYATPAMMDSESSYQSRKDGRPCAGLVPTETAVANHMVELLPKSGVFVYPKDIKVASKKKSGCAIARHLMSVFYTNQELIDAGNVTGANGFSVETLDIM